METIPESLTLTDLLHHQHVELLKRLDVQDDMLRQISRFRLPPLPSVPVTRDGSGLGLASEVSLETFRPRRTSVVGPHPQKFQSPQRQEVHDRLRKNPSMRTSKKEESLSCLQLIVRHPFFEAFFGVVVLTNAIFIGVDVHMNAIRPQNTDATLRIVQYIYAGLFTTELILKICAEGREFLWSEEWAWNYLDVFIVLSSVWDVGVDIVEAVIVGAEVDSIAGVSSLKSFRIIRLTRLLRTVQFVRIFRFVIALRTLVTSILCTMKALVWALFLLALIVYIFAVLFTQVMTDYLQTEGGMTVTELEAAKRYFGSLTDSMLALFLAISNGVSWEVVLLPLQRIGLGWVFCFLCYMSFTYFCVLNVVTAVFCQSAIESAQNDQITMMQAMLMNKEKHLQKIHQLFEQLGADDSGVITLKIFEENINSPDVRAYFETLGLDVWDAWSFFKLLDSDGGGSVDVEEFFMGCLRFRGQAKAMDVGKVIQDQAALMKLQSRFERTMKMELRQLQLQLTDLKFSGRKDEPEDWSPGHWAGVE